MFSEVINAQIKYKIDNYSTEDGLSHNIIRDILEDREGFMWFATWDGINRFDGKNFITYKASAGDHNVLGNNRIDLLKEDNYGNIWLKANDNQIYRFNKKTKKFISISQILKITTLEFNDIIPAPDGNIWLTTLKNGIYQVHQTSGGKIEITHFAVGLESEFLLSSNHFNFVIVDQNNSVWVGSNRGLDRISKSNKQHYFTKKIVEKRKVISFFSSNNSEVWFGGIDGNLSKYNFEKQICLNFKISSSAINAIIQSRVNHLIYVTTSSGEILAFNPENLKVESKLKISNAPLYKIFEDHTGFFWVEPEKAGVFRVGFNNRKSELFTQKVESSIYQLRDSYEIFQDHFFRVWVKLKGGGFGFFNEKTKTFDYFLNRPGDSNQKFSNMVSTTLIDKEGILWMSTIEGGIYKIILQKDNFEHHLMVSDAHNKLENEVRAIYSDKENRLWMASKAGALKIFSHNHEVKNLFPNFDADKFGLIYSIIEDHKSNIWLGTKGNGLFKLTPKNDERSAYEVLNFKKEPGKESSLGSDLIYSILEDQKGNIWIGTFGNGLNLLQEVDGKYKFTQKFKNFPLQESGRVRHLEAGINGQIWVATTNGLVTFFPSDYNSQTLKFPHYSKSATDSTSLNSNDVLFVFKDSENKMWLSTAGGGLNLAIRKKNGLHFKNFTKKDGLSSDFILSIAEDGAKNLWLTTENGISKFNLKNQTFRNFDSYDGLVKTRFSEATSLKLSNGNLMFGCVDGYLTLDPNKISNQKQKATMVFTDLEINNKSANVNAEGSILKEDINYTQKLSLNYKNNTISIYFSTLDYIFENKQLYAYRLKGLDDNWHKVKNQRKATFTNLSPGDYLFEVKCLNTELYSNIPYKSLAFSISPPFWKTSLAYIIYALLILVFLEIARRIAASMIKLRNKVVVEKKMTDLKLSFFTNISHELRTPLTLIVNPLEEISKNEDLSHLGREYIEIARKNTERLVKFVNQLLDFRKVQSGSEVLVNEPIEMVSFIKQMISFFSKAANEKDIKIKTIFSSRKITALLDRGKMDIILYNLLSNAVKFSPYSSKIIIELKVINESILHLAIIDEGTGVEENQLREIFKLYYEIENAENNSVGTGIGLALCKEYVELQNGKIFAKNNANKGLTIAIEFYLTEIKTENEFPENNENSKEENLTENLMKTIPLVLEEKDSIIDWPVVLIVEDNLELRSFLKIQLQPFYEILEAKNGVDGLKTATKHLPDLILSDIMMPEMDGVELLRHLKNTTETSHIPLILLTAKSSIENQIEGLKYGADYYITKPFNTDFLLASVANLIKKRREFFEKLKHRTEDFSAEPRPIVITTKDEQFLKDVISIVEEGLTDPDFNIEILLKSLNVSRATFNRKFKSLTNTTAVEYLKNMRVNRGKQYFDAGEKDIATIAYNVGFSNAGYFSTCFREAFGISPSEYLKQKN